MNHIYSSRDIQTACRRDINFMYLLEGVPAPDHATIARFKYLHFSQLSEEFLAAMAEWLYEHGEISGHDIFIDGTKIESCAKNSRNTYIRSMFVVPETVTKKLIRMPPSCV